MISFILLSAKVLKFRYQTESCRRMKKLFILSLSLFTFGYMYAISIFHSVFFNIIILYSSHASDVPGNTEPFLAGYGAVASANEECNKVGVEILKKGGNAVDATISTSLCLTVLHIFETGIGGGGIMMVAMNNKEPVAINCREYGTFAHHENIFDGDNDLSWNGGLSVGVPGELKCLQYAYKNYASGKLTWKELFQPAIRLAKSYKIHKLLFLRIEEHQERLKKDLGLSELFFKDGKIVEEGSLASNEKLAKTLEAISNDEELESFYHGDIMRDMVEEINLAGGNITEDDFKEYEIVAPTEEDKGTYKINYRGFMIYVPKLPFAGSLMMAQSLNMLEKIKLGKDLMQEKYILTETMKFGFANRLVLGDPNFPGYDFTDVEEAMLSKDHAQELLDRINPDMTQDPEQYLDLYEGTEILEIKDEGTEHLSVIDKDGNAVAYTASINYGWGAGFRGMKTGITYNNELDDFNIPGKEFKPNSFNYPSPKKRPLSTMTPTIVYDNNNELFLVTGASGGARIYTAVLSTLVDIIDYKLNLNESVNKVRVHHQLTGNLLYESFVSDDELAYMKEKGHEVSRNEIGPL